MYAPAFYDHRFMSADEKRKVLKRSTQTTRNSSMSHAKTKTKKRIYTYRGVALGALWQPGFERAVVSLQFVLDAPLDTPATRLEAVTRRAGDLQSVHAYVLEETHTFMRVEGAPASRSPLDGEYTTRVLVHETRDTQTFVHGATAELRQAVFDAFQGTWF